jgi:hypothetical protein
VAFHHDFLDPGAHALDGGVIEETLEQVLLDHGAAIPLFSKSTEEGV